MKKIIDTLCCLMTKTPWRKILDFIPTYTPGKPIEEVKREIGLEKVVKLASNENALGPSESIVKAICEAAKDVNRYPAGDCYYLREALSEKLSMPKDTLIFGNGSDEIISLALRAFVERGNEVVIADPTFLIYRLASVIAGAKVHLVPLKNNKYDLEGMLRVTSCKTKIIFIANPDNPSGTYVTQAELDSFLKKVPKDTLVFLDEAYYEFAAGGDYPSGTPQLTQREDRNIIVTRTFSKAYGLAGLRVGYGISRKDIIVALNKVREPFNVNSLAQAAAIAAIKDEDYLKASVSLVKDQKKRFYEKFESLGVEYIPSLTNFVMVDTKRDSLSMYEYLLKNGVIIREMSPWGYEGFIRVNVGTSEENDFFFAVFEKALQDIPVQS